MSHNKRITSEIESDIESRYSQPNVTGSISLINADSMINKFSPCYSSHSSDIGKKMINQMVDDVLLIKRGDFLGSSTECSTIRAESELSTSSSKGIGQRITYWQNYLKEHARISEKLARATGKDKNELLLNRTEEYRKLQQCKTIMNVAERLYPTQLATRQPITTKKIPCMSDIYETLPLQERLQKSLFTFTEMPKITLQEQAIDDVQVPNSSWLHSKYLGEKYVKSEYKIKRVLDHYPDIEQLQVVGTKIKTAECKAPEKAEVMKADRVDFRITDAWYRSKEPTLEYVIAVGDKEFDAEKKWNANINFWFTFECKPFEEKTRKLTIRNKGWKAIDVYWTRVQEKRLRCLPRDGAIYPSFYFNKNLTRIHPGISTAIEFVFCCKEFGVYEEYWEMKLIPEFLAKKCKMTISLFGKCEIDSRDKEEFQRIESNFRERAAKQIAQEVIYEVATYARAEPPLHKPYSTQFTQNELFSIVNPNLNYNEDCVEQLKNIYTEIIQDDHSKTCKMWHFDMKEMKSTILNVTDEIQRKELFTRYNRLIAEMKTNTVVFSPNYDDQKLLLVRNVLLTLADSMEKTVIILEDSILTSRYDLNFDEVLVTDAKFKPRNMVDFIDGSEHSEVDDDATSVCVVKSEYVRKKKLEAYQESLYIQTYGQLCTAVDQIVSIIEGIQML